VIEDRTSEEDNQCRSSRERRWARSARPCTRCGAHSAGASGAGTAGDCGVHCKSWRGDEPQSGVERAGGDTGVGCDGWGEALRDEHDDGVVWVCVHGGYVRLHGSHVRPHRNPGQPLQGTRGESPKINGASSLATNCVCECVCMGV